MTVKELKKIIENLDDDMLVGDYGHYGELLDCYRVAVKPLLSPIEGYKIEKFLCISIEDPGDVFFPD